jgi:ferredoxin
MTSYKLYTERVGPDFYKVLDSIISDHGLDAYTIIESRGMYRGKTEMSVVIEFIEADERTPDMLKLAQSIGDAFEQESVLLTQSEVEVYFVETAKPAPLSDCDTCENCTERCPVGPHLPISHREFSQRAHPAKPCSVHDMGFGGKCYNCGYEPGRSR